MYIFAHKKRLNWMYCTVFFGALPLLLRLLISSMLQDQTIPMVVISDVVFFGIMLNVAAFHNVTNTEGIPDVQFSATAGAFIRSALLIAFYTIALLPIGHHWGLWCVVTLVVLYSGTASFMTTDSDHLHFLQEMYALANRVEGLPPKMRRKAADLVRRYLDEDKKFDLQSEVNKIYDEYAAEQNCYNDPR